MNKLFTKIAALSLGAAMAVGVGVAVASKSKSETVEPVQALTASDISSSPVSSVTAGKKYVIAASTNAQTAPSGSSFLAAKASNTWGTAVAIGSAYEFTAEGSGTSGFYLKCTDGYLAPKTGTSNSFLQYASSKSNAVQLQLKNTYELFSNSNAHYNLRQNGTSGFRWYGTASADGTTGTAARLYEVSEGVAVTGVTLNKNALTLTVGESETLTATVSPNDATDKSVTWSSSKPSVALATNGTISAQSAGTATITVTTTDGGYTDTCAVTVNAPSTPTLSIDKASFSGYTGQSVSITATYSNLESDLAWSASGTGSITGGSTTWSSSDHRNGTSTYTCTLSAEGVKTIVADADGVDAAQCAVTITQTTVDITKASTSIPVGRSETLAASHNASGVGGLNWTSSNDSIATVGSDGKVTVAAGATVGATVTITATSSVDTGISDTCTVTVAAAPLDTTYDFVTNFSSYNTGWTNSYGEHTGINGKTQVGGDYAATIDLYYASKQTGTIIDRPVIASKTGSGSWTKVVGFTLTEVGYKIGDVSVTFSQWGTKTPDIALFSGDEASGTPLDSGTVGTKNTISTTGLNATEFTVGYCDKNTGSNVQSGLTSIYITLVRENALDHVTVSFASDPADRTFYAGSNFAFNGTLTASYTVDSPKAVTPTGYFLEGEEGEGDEITTSTILTVADYNGGEVYVQYEEGGVTKYDTFILVVNPAPATSVTLSANVGSVALEEVFEVSSITATVNPQAYATQGVTWDIYDLGGLTSSDYAFDNGEFMASKPADVVFHVKANSNNSIYATFTLTITGDPIVHLLDGELADVTDGSTTVFADAGVLTYGVTTENFEGTITYGWSTSSSATIAIDDDQGDTCDFLVKAAGSARLSCHVQGSTKGDVTVYIDVTVSAVTVTSVTWTAPSIDVYSGTLLDSTSGWNVKYSTDSGKTDQTPDSFNIKLGGTTISLPHTWVAADDTKTLCVEVGGVSSSTTTVAVTQSINAVTASITSSWDHTFTAKAWSAAGDWTISEKLWNMSGTDDGSPYFGYDGTKGQQFGSGTHPFSDVSLQSSAFSGTIDSVTVYTSGANSINATVQVSVGGTAYGSAQTITNTNTAYTFDLGGKSGTISIDWVNSSSKAIYVKEIVVNTATGSTNIANDDDYKAAQRAVVAFAQAFNAAMDDTDYCTTGLDAAWTTCSNAYTSFCTAAAALGEAQEERALNLVKHATRAYSDDSPEACLERMMKTYEICVQKHGKTAFMSDLVTLGRVVTPVNAISNSGTEVAIIVVTSMIGLSAVGGYFFLRKRKENI